MLVYLWLEELRAYPTMGPGPLSHDLAAQARHASAHWDGLDDKKRPACLRLPDYPGVLAHSNFGLHWRLGVDELAMPNVQQILEVLETTRFGMSGYLVAAENARGAARHLHDLLGKRVKTTPFEEQVSLTNLERLPSIGAIVDNPHKHIVDEYDYPKNHEGGLPVRSRHLRTAGKNRHDEILQAWRSILP